MHTPASEPDLRLRGRFVQGDERRYRTLPFVVPDGVRQLHIRLEYNDRIASNPFVNGGNTLDLGVFDERGATTGSPGFRGWSGSERLAITIGADWATPPYRPGPIGSGAWSVLLGPYKIGARGLDYEVGIWFDPDLPRAESPIAEPPRFTRARVPSALEPGWVRGDLHCHSLYSDGDAWPIEILIEAAELGLDFLAITDHNGAFRLLQPDLPGLPLLVPGNETTTYRGHWNVWGVDDWFDFRDPEIASIEAEMRRATGAGGLVSINHPKPFGPDWDYGQMRGAHAIEVWNGPWERMNVLSVAEWEERLLRGERFVALGGSDAHVHREPLETGPLRRAHLAEPTMWVQVDGPLTVASLLAGLRAGRAFISESPSGPQLYLTGEGSDLHIRTGGAAGATLQLIAEGETIASIPIDAEDWSLERAFPDGATYVRAQIVRPESQVLAFSNPVWRC